MIISCPLEVPAGNKTFRLNLNQYRRTHYQVLNKAKISFSNMVFSEVKKLPKFDPPISITYTLYDGCNRDKDLSNICCIVDKFFCDILVRLKKIPDDNRNYVDYVVYRYGGLDKQSPRCEVAITTKPMRYNYP